MASTRQTKSRGPKSRGRIQFELSSDAIDDLDRLVSRSGAATRAEVLRRALSLLATCTEAAERGAELLLKEQDGSRARVLLI